MLTRFQQHLHKLYPSFQHDTFLLAVSGGLDSMVMLDLFRRAKLHIAVAHVNFGLRGIDSDGDEQFIRDFCEKRSIRFHSRRVETKNYATGHGLSVQMAARELRYGYFNELISTGQANVVATAHHLNDNIETMLMGLLRGGGAEILAGMPSVNGNVIRPLLFARREELEKYAAGFSVTWREDLSNYNDDYVRNVLRHDVVPKLKTINPSLESAFERTVQKAKGQMLLSNRALADWQLKHVKQLLHEAHISKQGIRDAGEPEALLFFILEQRGFNFDQVSDIVRSLDGQPGKTFYSPSHRLVIDREDLIVTMHAPPPASVAIPHMATDAVLGSYRLTLMTTSGKEVNTDPNVACLDARKIGFPLLWRTWQAGDIFQPLGMEGRRKVSDFLIDLKLSRADKDRVSVVQSGDDIIWLPGFRVDHRYRVTETTTSVLVMRLERLKA